MVAVLTGWIDAGGAARAAADAIEDDAAASPIAEFDDDVYVDYRARRPIMELRDGLNSVLNWERITLTLGRDQTGRDVLLLTGPEPDMAWHRFTRAVGELAELLGVRQFAHLGAYPFATPHTRPARISVTSPSQDVLMRVPYLRSSIDVPAGVAAALEHEMHERGIPSIGIWAQVPHYIASMTYPAASVALLDGLREATGLVIDAADAAQRRDDPGSPARLAGRRQRRAPGDDPPNSRSSTTRRRRRPQVGAGRTDARDPLRRRARRRSRRVPPPPGLTAPGLHAAVLPARTTVVA